MTRRFVMFSVSADRRPYTYCGSRAAPLLVAFAFGTFACLDSAPAWLAEE
jgi:hypothetical protein